MSRIDADETDLALDDGVPVDDSYSDDPDRWEPRPMTAFSGVDHTTAVVHPTSVTTIASEPPRAVIAPRSSPGQPVRDLTESELWELLHAGHVALALGELNRRMLQRLAL